MKKLVLLFATASALSAVATPTISDMKVTPIAPWGVAIDYTVSGATDADNASLCFDVTMVSGAATNVAQTLFGATNCVNGAHRVYWNMAKDGLTATLTDAEISVRYATPRYCVVDLSKGSSATAYPVAYYVNAPDGGFTNEIYKTTKLVLKRVEVGTFIMGSDQTNEAHRVTLTKPFYMGLYEVTQKQWYQIMGTTPVSSTTYGKGDAYPVNRIGYNADIRGSDECPSTGSFMGKLRDKTELVFDLPTEAQWEYTCRAGTTTTYSYGNDADGDYMWYTSNSSKSSQIVGTKKPNPWGFYDMHGNVWESCRDWNGTLAYGTDPSGVAKGSSRIIRGGGFDHSAGHATSFYRDGCRPDLCHDYYGFRAESEVPTTQKEFIDVCETVRGLNVEVIADGSSFVARDIEIGYAPDASTNAVVTIEGATVVDAAVAGTYLWQPREPQTYALAHTVGDITLSATYNVSARPVVVSDLKVTSIEPLGLAIDFTISEATSRDLSRPIEVSMSVGDTNYTAKALSGATNCVNGAHRVYWNMAADGLSVDSEDAIVTVKYGWPLYCVIDLSGGSMMNSYPVSYMSAPPSEGFTNTVYKTTKLVLKRVEAGTFIMGSDQTNESHRVTLTKPFYMGLYEVTQKQWYQIMGTASAKYSYGEGDARPVYYVAYKDIRGSLKGGRWPTSNEVDGAADGDGDDSFLGRLRKRTGIEFDLPTEAQWEYTCRAGTTTTYSYGNRWNGDYMWYTGNSIIIGSIHGAHVVGTKEANPWGFYDMHGNVKEWCLDWYGTLAYGADPKGESSGEERVLRGGDLNCGEGWCTSAYRSYGSPTFSGSDNGFRCAVSSIGDSTDAVGAAKVVAGHICADGNFVDGALTLGAAPTAEANAVVSVDGEEVVCATDATTFLWQARTKGEHVISHTVGDITLLATYNVTNLLFWTPAEPNPPMDVVETITISPESKTFATANASGSSIMTEGSGEWTAAVSDDWITLAATSGAAGKNVAYRIAANAGLESRVGYVYVAGRVHKIVQAGRETLTATLDRTDLAVGASGGAETIAVAPSNAEMTWRVQTDAEWLSVSPTEGVGEQSVNIQVASWCELGARTGTVFVVDQVVTVVQTGSSFAVVGAEESSAVAQGDTGVFAIEATAGLTWTATSDADWLTLTDASGTGDGSVAWTAAAQTTFEPRTATITVVAQTANCRAEYAVSVVQAAAKVTFEGGNTRCYNADGAFNETVMVHVDVADIPWMVTLSDGADGWLYLFSEAEHAGDDVEISFMVDAATVGTTELPRTATIAVGNATLTVTQDDAVVIDEGSSPFFIPTSWFAQYPTMGGSTVAELQVVAEDNGVKSAPVWHDYVAGTDPTNALSKFTAMIEMKDGVPIVTWSPNLNGEGVRGGVRVYRVWGKANLGDAAWSEVGAGEESDYRFFRVTVEMP